MYRQSMANGAAASLLFFIFLFFLARHMRRLHGKSHSLERHLEAGTLPPPYFVVPSQPPPTYQEAITMGGSSVKF